MSVLNPDALIKKLIYEFNTQIHALVAYTLTSAPTAQNKVKMKI